MRAHGFPCAQEVERRLAGGEFKEALLVAQTEDLDALRALQDRLSALECEAFVSESTSWRANLWETVAAPWRAGFVNGLSSLVSARTRAIALTVAVFFVLLAGFAAVSGLASRDRGSSTSPMERLTESHDAPRAPGATASASNDDPTRRPASTSAGGAATGSHETEGDLTATALEIGAFFGGLLCLFVVVAVAAKRARRLGHNGRRVVQAFSAVALLAGVWVGTRPREVDHERGLARADSGGATSVEGPGALVEDPDASTDEAPEGGSDSPVVRELRGPFDRFVRGLEVRAPMGPPPTFAALLASMRAAAPSNETAVTEGTSEDHRGREADAGALAAQTAARSESHHRHGHDGERHARSSHGHRASRHARRGEEASPARYDERGDAGVALAPAPDASIVAVARSVGAPPSASARDAASSEGAGRQSGSTRLARSEMQPSSRRAQTQRVSTIDIRRERPRLGAWFVVGLALASLLSGIRRKETA